MKESDYMIKSGIVILFFLGLYIYVFSSLEKEKSLIKESINYNVNTKKKNSHW